jgi:hypothetical protein
MEQVGSDLHLQLERRKEHLKKMVNDVMQIGESLHNLVADFGDQKRTTFDVQNKLQSNLYVLDQILRPSEDQSRGRSLRVGGEPQAARPLTPINQRQDGLVQAGIMAGTLPAGSMAVSASVRPVQSVIYRS